jgi:hypothetical protein
MAYDDSDVRRDDRAPVPVKIQAAQLPVMRADPDHA